MTTDFTRRDSETDRHRRRIHVSEMETDPLPKARPSSLSRKKL